MVCEQAASQLPTFYVCPVGNIYGSVPLIPGYMIGNKQNTIPHSLRYEVPHGAAADCQAEQLNRQPPFRGQHLDVALWERVPQKDLGGGCRREVAGSCYRVQAQGG